MRSTSPSATKMPLAVSLLAYLIFALIFGFAYRYVINPDGISLLRLSGYIAEGNFLRSVTSGWSPLMIWVVSPFLYIGLDGLTAARIAIAFCGVGLLLACWCLSSRFDLSNGSRFVALLIAALLISFWTVQWVASDVLLTALTVFYIFLVTDPGILDNRRAAFLCGVAGGFSYLAHHYAFPFFTLHYPVLLLLHGYINRGAEGVPWRKVFFSWTAGIAGFVMIASMWIGIVSVKYGELTISSKGGAAHAIMGPKDVDRGHPYFAGGLFKPKDDYAMHVFEDPSEVEFKTWSPFESREYFIHQLKVIKGNAIYILNHFVNNSPFFTYAFVIGVLAFIPIALLLNPLNNRKKFLYSWVIITFCIYSSGFLLLIARSPRRFYALMLVFLFVSFHFLEEMKNALGSILSGHRMKILSVFLLIIGISAFALKPGVQLLKSIRYLVAHEQMNPYAEIAEHINSVEFESPYAIIRSSQKPHTDTFIAYYIGKQLLGRPLSSDADGITNELVAAGARSLLVFDNPEIVEELKSDNRYVHLERKELDSGERYDHTVNINIRDHEIITGWDSEVNVFALK